MLLGEISIGWRQVDKINTKLMLSQQYVAVCRSNATLSMDLTLTLSTPTLPPLVLMSVAAINMSKLPNPSFEGTKKAGS